MMPSVGKNTELPACLYIAGGNVNLLNNFVKLFGNKKQIHCISYDLEITLLTMHPAEVFA